MKNYSPSPTRKRTIGIWCIFSSLTQAPKYTEMYFIIYNLCNTYQ